MTSSIDRASSFSKEKLSSLRAEIGALSLPSILSVVTTGSFARNEANSLSDLDFFLLVDNKGMLMDTEYISAIRETIGGIVRKVVGSAPSSEGAFGGFESVEDMLINIGGVYDDNDKITRRILLLLEGEWLSNKELFDETRKRLVCRYVDENIKRENISRFLLNDIIRYYRTICVDFEYKTFEARKGWGIRNIKLVYSRKLLYLSGILCVAETACKDDKRNVVQEIIKESPICRIRSIGGESSKSILNYYDMFLEAISDPEIREELSSIGRDDHGNCTHFTKLKNDAQAMNSEIKSFLMKKYSEKHPIHLALLL